MKVLHVISGGDTGGAKTSVITLLSSLKKLMHVRVVCFMEGPFTKEARENGIDTVILKQKNRFDLSVVKELTDMVKDEGFDLINGHGARANFILAKAKPKLSVPVVTTVHSDYEHDFDNDLIKKIIFTWLNKRSLRQCDYYITMAERFKKDMISRGFEKNRLFVAYNGIKKGENSSLAEPEKFLKKYGITYDKTAYYVGSATRLHPIKGVDVLLKAAKIVHEKEPKIIFLIAGYGDERYLKEYEDYIRNNNLEQTVFILGFIEHIHHFYQILDVNTITSHSEAVCYALLEGGIFSKPSIGSRVGGTPELIEHNKTGILFEDNDSQGLADEIIRLYRDNDLAKALGEALCEKVNQQFTDEAMAKRYEEIYSKIMRG